MTTDASAADVATALAVEVNKEGVLYQTDAAELIEKLFGNQFLIENDTGGVSIRPDVLAEFRRFTEESVVWDRAERAWRKREKYDGPGRLAD